MLQSKKFFLLISIIAVLVILVSVYIIAQKYLSPGIKTGPGVHAYLEPDQFDDWLDTRLWVVNNTAYPIRPSVDTFLYEWRVFRRTRMGWERFTLHDTDSLWIPSGIDQPLSPKQIGQYNISDVLLSSATFNPLIEFPPARSTGTTQSEGVYMVQVHYVQQLSQGEVPLVTHTPPVTYRQANISDDEIAITLEPVLQKREGLNLVEFTISNESSQEIWLRPLALQNVQSFYKSDNLTLMKQVDETSWEYVVWDRTIRDKSDEPIMIGAGETRHLQGNDLNTEFIIDEPGVYRWIMLIFLEYFPEGTEGKAYFNKDTPILVHERYLFSEPLVVD